MPDVTHRRPAIERVMDCLAFRRHHLAYVDDTLPGDVLVAAERHRVECADCAALDTRVRRSLLLARNLPTLEPSADFAARLEARLREVRAEGPARGDVGQDAAVDFDLGAEDVRWYATWVERARRDAGGWGRQAAAAAVLFAAASAGYAVRGMPAGVSERAPAEGGVALGGAQLGVTSSAATPSVPALAASASAAAESLSRVGAAAVNTTEVAALGVAARAAQGAHALRRRAAGAAARAAGDAFDADGLGTPAYIPLPGGALEAAALLGPASAGVPVWPAALLAGEAPGQLRSVAPGAPSVRVVGLTH